MRIYIVLLSLLLTSIAFAQSEDPSVDSAAVEALILDEEFENAIARVDAALKKHKKDETLLLQKGFILVQLNRVDDAFNHYKKIVRKLKKNPEPGNNLAMVMRMQGKRTDAIAQLKKTIKKFPGYAKAYENLGDIYIEIAQNQYKEGLDQVPDNELLASKSDIANRFGQIAQNNTRSAKRRALAIQKEAERKAQEERLKAEEEIKQLAEDQAKRDKLIAEEESAFARLSTWITAWSDRDIDGYLSHYSTEFQPLDGLSLPEWIGTKREIIGAAEYIKINLDKINLTRTAEDEIVAHFVQAYESNTLLSESLKTLTLKLYNGQWLIIREEDKPAG